MALWGLVFLLIVLNTTHGSPLSPIDRHLMIQSQLDVCDREYIGTNHSAISRGYGFGYLDDHHSNHLRHLDIHPFQVNTAWQSLTLSQQLDIGVRALQMDVHWVSGSFWISTCAGMQARVWQGLYAAVLNKWTEWDVNTVECAPELNDPQGIELVSVIEELHAWINNPRSAITPILVTLNSKHPVDKMFEGIATRNTSEVSNTKPILLKDRNTQCGHIQWHSNSLRLGPFNTQGEWRQETKKDHTLSGQAIQSFIWSWRNDHTTGNHVVQSVVDGRWFRVDLSPRNVKACRNMKLIGPHLWRLGGSSRCPPDTQWSYPVTRQENDQLWKLAQMYDIRIGVWLNIT
ncbi:MAG: hypothetical protein K0U52_06550 [Gammaproteobacteria bacterium]|nr:hypothetical protein [Gammaproteobacteria bacterium]